jgi:hypothetical protein
MTDVAARAAEDWSQLEIERDLMDRANAAAKARIALRTKAREVGIAKAQYKAIRATTALRLRAEDIETGAPARGPGAVTESVREARVDANEQVKDAALRYYIAEAEFEAEQEAARLLRTEMAALQSILADLRPMVSER